MNDICYLIMTRCEASIDFIVSDSLQLLAQLTPTILYTLVYGDVGAFRTSSCIAVISVLMLSSRPGVFS